MESLNAAAAAAVLFYEAYRQRLKVEAKSKPAPLKSKGAAPRAIGTQTQISKTLGKSTKLIAMGLSSKLPEAETAAGFATAGRAHASADAG